MEGSSQVKRVLIVDDHPDIRMMCRVNLALEGYEVIEACDGEAGLAAMEQHPDLVILDVMLPGVLGWEVLERIKADTSLAATPVIMLTALAQRQDEVRGWLAGAAGYISKPFNPSTLSEAVREAIDEPNAAEHRRRELEKLAIL